MLRIFFIGSGRLAHNLAHAFSKTDVEIMGVYSRNAQHALDFSKSFDIPCYTDLSNIPRDCDVYFLAVSDKAVESVSEQLQVDGMVAHCSGMLSVEVLKKHPQRGVFWPIQSLNLEHYISFATVPVCIQSADELDHRLLEVLADKITRKTQSVDERKRNILHLSAVMVNNFSNHLYVLAKRYLEENNLSFELLIPIIQETAHNILNTDPVLAQTGPASRGDLETMEKHRVLLSGNPEMGQIYEIISHSILHQKD